MDPYAYFGVCAALIGLLVGSFLNVCIARLPEGRSIAWPGSHCPRCGQPVHPRDNVPVLSWILLRGHCRSCRTPISPLYPLVELLGGLLGWLAYRRIVPDATALDLPHLAAWTVLFGFLCLLVVAAYVDLRHWIIPDEVSIYAAPAGILSMVALGALDYGGAFAVAWREAVLGAVFAGGFFVSAAAIARMVLQKEGLGWGDVKFIAMIGTFTGYGVYVVVLLAALIGTVVGLFNLLFSRRYFPYGPSLAAAAGVYALYGDWILEHLLPGVGMMFELLRG